MAEKRPGPLARLANAFERIADSGDTFAQIGLTLSRIFEIEHKRHLAEKKEPLQFKPFEPNFRSTVLQAGVLDNLSADLSDLTQWLDCFWTDGAVEVWIDAERRELVQRIEVAGGPGLALLSSRYVWPTEFPIRFVRSHFLPGTTIRAYILPPGTRLYFRCFEKPQDL